MAAINPDWYAAQATRAYPLDDAATARDDAGLSLPSQILVDCRIKFPLALGRFAYLGGVTVGPTIITALIMATPDAARPPGGASANGVGFQPLGAISLPRPVTPNRHYPIQPMATGVGGWLVFGRGINDEPYSGRFSSPNQSLLLPRVASAYHPLPIPTLGKLGLAQSLTGVVQLLGGTDLTVFQGLRNIDGAEVNAVVLSLVDSLNRNVFSLYTGPCGGRPESNTCNKPALETINSIEPDCDGNLTIEFQGVDTYNFANGGGIALDLSLGMADVCLGQDNLPDAAGNLPGASEGDCAPPEVITPPPTVPPGTGLPPSPADCAGVPYYESFDGVIPTAWLVLNGTFDVEADDSPAEPYGLEAPGTGTPGVAPGFTGLPPLHKAIRTTDAPGIVPVDKSYCATDPSQRNVAIWNCDYDPTADLTCVTQFKLMDGAQINGGIIWNYNAIDPLWNNRPSYYLVTLDLTFNALVTWQYHGTSIGRSVWIPLLSPAYDPPVLGDWYALSVRSQPSTDPTLHGNSLITATLTGISDPTFNKVVLTDNWPLTTGKFGIGTVNAYTRFSFFQLGATSP